jgi:hypothetical protein
LYRCSDHRTVVRQETVRDRDARMETDLVKVVRIKDVMTRDVHMVRKAMDFVKDSLMVNL